MPFHLPPIVERELRVASRRPAVYWTRVSTAGSGIAVGCWILGAQMVLMPARVAGQFTFRLLAVVTILVVITNVLQFSSQAFAREKREDTLGLLFLTPLRPVEIVIGKLVSASLAGFYQFLAMIPVLALPMLAGGVSVKDFALFVLGLLNVAFLAATLGLYVSARSWDEKRASGVAGLLAMFIIVALPACIATFGVVNNLPNATSALALSPAFPIWLALFARTGGSVPLLASLAWTQVLGWIFFRAACRTLPKCWQQRPLNLAPRGDHLQPQRRETTTTPFLVRTSGTPTTTVVHVNVRESVRRQFDAQQRAWMLDRNPLFWMAMRSRPRLWGSAWIIGAIGLVICVPVFLSGEPKIFFHPGFALAVFFCVNAACKTHLATQASQAFARDRGDDMLQLLLSTPVTSRQLIEGHLLALRKNFRPFIQRLFWIEAGWLAFTIAIESARSTHTTLYFLFLSAALLGLLIPDLYAVCWTALWHGVVARNAREAEKAAFSQVLMLPWIATSIATTVTSWLLTISGLTQTIGVLAVVAIVFSAVIDWWFIRESRRHLETRLHMWALRRSAGEFEHYDGWRRIGRWLGRWWRTQRGLQRA